MNKIITISRQYGSGGREIGEKLAKKLGIPFYDNELITRAAKESGFTESVFERAESKATNSLLYS
ncbi:cytidylate kinase-like family protein, partial [Anaerosporobacter sp.]